MHEQFTTVAELAYDLRNQIMGLNGHEGAGAITFLITTWAALRCGSARRKAALKRDPRTPRMRAADKARMNLELGAAVVIDGEAALVQSATRGGVVHRVEGHRCTCEAGQSGKACWHVEAARQERAARVARRREQLATVFAVYRSRELVAA